MPSAASNVVAPSARSGWRTADAKRKATTERKADGEPGSKPKPEAKVKSGSKARSGSKATSGSRAKRRPGASRSRSARAGGRARAAVAEARKLGGGAGSALGEVVKRGRGMLVIPVQLWLAAAEVAGAFVLKIWMRGVRPLWAALRRLAAAAFRLAARHLTPARAVAAVGLVAAGALAASQWLDYHSVSVGIDAYAGEVGAVAPAPEVESEIAGNAHAWVMVPIAIAAVAAVAVALAGRRRVAVLLVPIGLAVIAISLIVDAPKGLDEGAATLTYEGASASLLEGFWMQIAAAVVLIACGLLLPRYLRPASARAIEAARRTGPTLFEQLGAAVRKRTRERPAARRKRPRGRLKRRVQGART